jgi:hypothetical protein
MAVFNNTAGTYTLPLTKISNMPKNKVQVFIDPSLIGTPSSFNYMTCVMVRVNSTFLSKPPDYMMDSVSIMTDFGKNGLLDRWVIHI